ncbi:hypothetical protein BRARA_C01579 [Brassica rapa]|uniref:Alpha-carbonic anhydrase domain-containing protein n=1 Tax=Brassica campestris TaxID=3711 RepID=A0A397ZV84_BRACM|nr:hypothetical protein BRARA_C01579 [Brassica rapa]
MEKSSIQCLLFILLTIISCSNAQREVEDESEFSYEGNQENGPEKWGKLKPEWKIKYYRYIGSLTIPPCTQNVIWTVIKKVRTVSRNQVKLLRVAVHDYSDTNARPVQPTNMRTVKLYRPKSS